MNKLRRFWTNLKESLWFVPTLMVIGAILLALILIEVDGAIDYDFKTDFPRVFGAGSDGSRGMLSAIAGSMITVAGLAFSLTVVTMAQTSSQYTSRILRNFMSDRSNQFVLGYFVSVFAYCLIVLRTIRGGDEGRFIPSLTVLFGMLLAIASIGVLIFFIHHIATSIQASVIIKHVADDTIAAAQELFPKELGKEADEKEKEKLIAEVEDAKWHAITSARNGYIQNIDTEGLINFAEKHDVVVRMEYGIGEFVAAGAPLASLANAGEIEEKTEKNFRELYAIADHRTIDKDVGFGIRQLVDIALKALSPGINDTTTAVICIDYLTAILIEIGKRNIESVYRSGDEKARIIAKGATFDSLVSESFDQIRDSAAGNATIYLRMLTAIEKIMHQISNPKRRPIVYSQISLIAADAERTLESDYNLCRVREKVFETRKKLKTDDVLAVKI